jgi:tetratricopeptide (TPR) repeat protein
MAENANTTPDAPQPSRPAPDSATKAFAPEIPPSKALKWFLLAALVITGAAYVTDQWTQVTISQTQVPHRTKLHRLVRSQAGYLAHAKAGDDAWAAQHYDQAVSEYRLALQNQNVPEVHEHLGDALLKTGDPQGALAQFREALHLNPNLRNANFQSALLEDHLGQYADAIAHYNKVLTLRPDDPDTLDHLALLYATATNAEVRSAKMAVQLATRASDAAAGQNARYMDTLARSYAADGDFSQALTWEDKAMRRATQLSDDQQVREFQQRYALFLDHKTQ